ncbi:MAG: sulfotransferase [Pseudomonadota bacterium]
MEAAHDAEHSNLLVYGALRSGSTLLRLMIDANPELHCPGEIDFLFDYVTLDQANGKWTFDPVKASLNRNLLSSGITCPDTTDAKLAVDNMLTQLRRDDPGKFVIMIHRHLHVAIALLGTLPVVHLLRDPRDVAASSIGMGWSGNVYYGADHWIRTEEEWARVSSEIPTESVFSLRFEELVANAESTLKDICAFCGVTYSPAMLEYHRSSTYDPVDPKLASQWRKKRSDHEIALIEHRVGALLETSGFEKSGVKPITLAGLGKLKLWLQNKAFIWRFRIKTHGFVDPLTVAIAERLKLGPLTRSAQLRMHERTRQGLK